MHFRTAVFVDAGYLYATGAFTLRNESVKRALVNLRNPLATLQALREKAAEITGNPNLLRVYWYDGQIGGSLTEEQTTLNLLPGLKLRLGTVNSVGMQKGVDSLILTDMIDLASKHAIGDAILLSGDEDVRVAMTIAQSYGVRVHLLGIGDYTTNTSASLRIEADSHSILDTDWLAAHLQINTPSPASAPASATLTVARMADANEADSKYDEDSVEGIALRVTKELLAERSEAEVASLASIMKSTRTIPAEFDRPLIKKTSINLGRRLEPEENRRIRVTFLDYLRTIPITAVPA